MTADPKRLIAVLAALAVGAVVWYATAPSALGGSADYSITSGISMEPRFSTGDLAVVRASSAYRVGDIVLYRSPVIHRPVLHRIIKIQDGHYYFKGDNNNFVDPGYVTRAELVGKLWVRVPLAGHVLQWLASPVKASIIAAFAVLLLTGGFFGGGKRRRRGRLAIAGLFDRLPVHRLERLPGTPTMAAGGLLVVLAIFVTATGFSTSMTRTGSDPQAMRHTGVFSYSAQTTRPSVAYPSGVVKTGDPIFFSNVDRVRFAFSYHFASSKAHVVHGTIGLVAEISSDTTTLTETFPLGKAHGFTGDAARTSYVLPLALARQFLTSLATESGTPGTLTASFRALVKLRGFVDGEPISETFAPVLPMKVGNTSIEMIDTTPVAPPGATYAPPSRAQEMAAVLHPVQAGAIPVLDQNQVALLRWRLDVDDARLLAAALWLLGLPLIVVGLAIHRRRPARSEEERIATVLRLMVVPVVSLAAGAERRIEVLDFMSLARFARFAQRPILFERAEGERLYGIEEGGCLYTYRAEGTGIVASVVAAARPPRLPVKKGRIGLLRPGIGLVVLLVAAMAATSFTATSTVPLSYAGTSSQPRTIAQLAPAACSSLALTSVVFGSGTFTNSASHALVLGTNGTDTIGDTGKFNCIVGGAGADKVTGDLTDVCIAGLTPGTSYKKCTIS